MFWPLDSSVVSRPLSIQHLSFHMLPQRNILFLFNKLWPRTIVGQSGLFHGKCLFFTPGHCPHVQVVKNFDMEKALHASRIIRKFVNISTEHKQQIISSKRLVLKFFRPMRRTYHKLGQSDRGESSKKRANWQKSAKDYNCELLHQYNLWNLQ